MGNYNADTIKSLDYFEHIRKYPGMFIGSKDLEGLHHCVKEIISNSIDEYLNGECTEIEVKIYKDKSISVKDNGIGIPRSSLNKIWERFYKTDASRGKDKKGTGLGLSIVKEIIQAHNENINVISTEGVGTEFIFSLQKG